MFPVLSGGKDSTPAKFQLDRFITVGGVDGQTHTHTQTHIPGPYVNYSKIWPLPEAIPQKLRKFFFRPIKKFFASGFKWG